MNKALSTSSFLCLALVLAMPPPAARAYQTTMARMSDVQRLQDDLAVLEDSLAAVPTSHPRHAELSDRADALRQDLVQIRDDMRRSQDGTELAVTLDELNRVHNRIRGLQTDVDTALDRRFTGGSALVPEGTEIVVRLEQPLSSRSARVEDRFDATVARPVLVDGRVVVPAGTRVVGTVTRAEPAKRPLRGGRLDLAFDRLLLDDGTSLDLATRVVQVKEDIAGGQTAERAGIGAALGGILGSVIGGTKGAIVGVLLGGAGGAVTAAGDDVSLPEGTVFTLQTERPLTVLRR